MRLSKVSKIYRLVKITRLIRLLRVMRRRKQLMKTMKNVATAGGENTAMERLVFFIVLLLIMSHLIACLWVYVARLTYDEEATIRLNWIQDGGYEEAGIAKLYTIALYFTIQSITTIGYGDMTINTPYERVICIFLHLIGVLSFSYAAGILTNLI